MAVNFNTNFDPNPLVEKILENPYGLALLIGLFVLAVIIALFSHILRSGILSTIREHQEFKARKIKEEITDLEELLEDESFKKYKSQIKYHLDVAKLNKLLKYWHYDKDLLEYILSCKDSRLAMMYYDAANFFIKKDTNTKEFRLKSFCHKWWINILNFLGTVLYFGISLSSLYPTAKIFYITFATEESLKSIPFSFVISQFLLFIICLALAMMVLSPMIKPWKAMKFLELEKIENDIDKESMQDKVA